MLLCVPIRGKNVPVEFIWHFSRRVWRAVFLGRSDARWAAKGLGCGFQVCQNVSDNIGVRRSNCSPDCARGKAARSDQPPCIWFVWIPGGPSWSWRKAGSHRDQPPLAVLGPACLLRRFSDVILATILATKSEMCGQKFELKIDNVRFVGHPTLLQHALGQVSKTDPSPKREAPTMILFNVVFALRANADPSVINCLHNLSRRIATVLQHEERRCQYLTREAKLILALQDEVSAVADANDGPQSPFHHILPKCKLARDLKEAYDSLCTSGVVRLHINSWLEVGFCLPHKIHYAAASLIPPEAIERSLKAIRPYHALLLLSDEKSLLGELPLDCSPALVRVIKTTSAVKNLQQLAQDADLALLQVFQLAAHLVYWGKAIIIYPLCENNVYMLSPNASVCLYSPLAEQFSRQFPAHDLPSVLAKFSLPVSLSEFRNPLAPPVQETQLIQMVVWMLQHRLLVQLHTYVCLMASPSEDEPHPREDDVPFATRVSGRSLSTPNALSFGSPSRSPLPRARVWWVGAAFGRVLGSGGQDPDTGTAGSDWSTFAWPHVRAHTHTLCGPLGPRPESPCPLLSGSPLKEDGRPLPLTSLYFCGSEEKAVPLGS
ncbi:GATOR complex protein NPRL3 isoform X2 [Lynx rufus]|uniref:GATOR complex protein NPRL3 isoform X2 n=1 Tax=Lynx rufus TaxID=61384 RepID=UPI001F12492B|nr:GATOR complex protein NPRL3 isoform X2 [Lynx rufus]